MQRIRQVASTLATAALLTGCAYPRVVSYYDEDCQIMARRMVVDATRMDILGDCQNDQCLTNFIVGVTVSATSTVIAGSIVYVGNVLYWKERNKNCRRNEPPLSVDPSVPVKS
jgi:hypothetical protein